MAIFTFFLMQVAYAQDTTMSESLKYEATMKTEKFKQRLLMDGLLTQSEMQFAEDTFYLNTIYNLKNTANPCQECLYEHVCSLTYDLEGLTKKYEGELMKKLSPNDQIAFKSSLINWTSFKEKEKKLLETINKPEYTGGGGVEKYNSALAYMQLLQFRLNQIAGYYFNVSTN